MQQLIRSGWRYKTFGWSHKTLEQCNVSCLYMMSINDRSDDCCKEENEMTCADI